MTQEKTQPMNNSWKIEDETMFKMVLDRADLMPVEAEVMEIVLLGDPEKLKKHKITKTGLGQLLRKTLEATKLISKLVSKTGESEEEGKKTREKADEKIKNALKEATKPSGDGDSATNQQGEAQSTPEENEDEEEEDKEEGKGKGKKEREKVCTDYKSARGCRFQNFPECGLGSHPKVCQKYENGVKKGERACEGPCPKGLYHKPICKFGMRCRYKAKCFDWHPPKAEKTKKEKEMEEKKKREKEEENKKEKEKEEMEKKKEADAFLEERMEKAFQKKLEEIQRGKLPGPTPFVNTWQMPRDEYCRALAEPFPQRAPSPGSPYGGRPIQGTVPWHQEWRGPQQPPWAYRTGPWGGMY